MISHWSAGHRCPARTSSVRPSRACRLRVAMTIETNTSGLGSYGFGTMVESLVTPPGGADRNCELLSTI
jgi:hypothetical protein